VQDAGDGADRPQGVHDAAVLTERADRDGHLADAERVHHAELAGAWGGQGGAERFQGQRRGVGRVLPAVHHPVRQRDHGRAL